MRRRSHNAFDARCSTVTSLAVEELPDTSNQESVVYIVQFIVESVRK